MTMLQAESSSYRFVVHNKENVDMTIEISNVIRNTRSVIFSTELSSDDNKANLDQVFSRMDTYHDICEIPKSLNRYEDIKADLAKLFGFMSAEGGHMTDFNKDYLFNSEGSVRVEYSYRNYGMSYCKPHITVKIVINKK